MFRKPSTHLRVKPTYTPDIKLQVLALTDPEDPLLDVAVTWAEKQWGPIKSGYKTVFQKLTQSPNTFYIIRHELHHIFIPLAAEDSKLPVTAAQDSKLPVARVYRSNPIGMFALRSWRQTLVGDEDLASLERKIDRLTSPTIDGARLPEESTSSDSSLQSDEEYSLQHRSLSPSLSRVDSLAEKVSNPLFKKLNTSLHAIEELDYVFLVEEARGVGLSKPVLEIAKQKAREAGAQLMVLQTLNPLVNARYKKAKVVCESRDREDRDAPTEFLSLNLTR